MIFLLKIGFEIRLLKMSRKNNKWNLESSLMSFKWFSETTFHSWGEFKLAGRLQRDQVFGSIPAESDHIVAVIVNQMKNAINQSRKDKIFDEILCTRVEVKM